MDRNDGWWLGQFMPPAGPLPQPPPSAFRRRVPGRTAEVVSPSTVVEATGLPGKPPGEGLRPPPTAAPCPEGLVRSTRPPYDCIRPQTPTRGGAPPLPPFTGAPPTGTPMIAPTEGPYRQFEAGEPMGACPTGTVQETGTGQCVPAGLQMPGGSRFPGLQRLLPLVGGGGSVQAPTLGGRSRSRPWPCGHAHPELNGLPHWSLGYGHPPPPGVCCQATPDGGTVCSDGFVGPPG